MLDTVRYEMEWSEDTAKEQAGGFSGLPVREVFKPVSSLSEEKSRLRLFLLMQHENKPPLILDEPTNHLDVASRNGLNGPSNHSAGHCFLFLATDTLYQSSQQGYGI